MQIKFPYLDLSSSASKNVFCFYHLKQFLLDKICFNLYANSIDQSFHLTIQILDFLLIFIQLLFLISKMAVVLFTESYYSFKVQDFFACFFS